MVNESPWLQEYIKNYPTISKWNMDDAKNTVTEGKGAGDNFHYISQMNHANGNLFAVIDDTLYYVGSKYKNSDDGEFGFNAASWDVYTMDGTRSKLNATATKQTLTVV